MEDKEYCFNFGIANQLKIMANQYIYFDNFLLGLIGNPTEVNIGIDNKNKVMLIKSVDEKLGNVKRYRINKNKTYCKKLIKLIFSITSKKSFEVVLDRELGGLLVNLGD